MDYFVMAGLHARRFESLRGAYKYAHQMARRCQRGKIEYWAWRGVSLVSPTRDYHVWSDGSCVCTWGAI